MLADSHLAFQSFLASNHVNLSVKPEQFTCAWFQSHLNTFIRSQNDILMVEGKTGTGKTVLANWTVDRLQRPIARTRTPVYTLTFAFNPSITDQASVGAMLKTLLLQLLESAIGNIGVYKVIKDLHHAWEAHSSSEDNEGLLWDALGRALESLDRERDDDLVSSSRADVISTLRNLLTAAAMY